MAEATELNVPTTDPPSTSRAPKAKPAWAKKPAWASQKPPTNNTTALSSAADSDMFSHANRAYNEILKDKERRKKERAEKQRAKEDRRQEKRRRISREDEEVVESLRARGSRTGHGNPPDENRTEESLLALRQSPTKVFPDKPKAPPATHIVELGSDSDDASKPTDAAHASNTAAPRPANQLDEDDTDYDPELRALVAQARSRQLQDSLSSPSPAQPPTGSVASPPIPPKPQDNFPSILSSPQPSPPSPDPIVQILVTSDLPGAVPLIVKRRVSQRLQEIREAWLSRQQLPPTVATHLIFLTWRNRRLYDVTTCLSLGIVAGPNGRAVIPPMKNRLGGRGGGAEIGEGLDGGDDDDGEDEEGRQEAKVHMVAVTPELFEENKKKARRAWEGEDDVSVSAGQEGATDNGGGGGAANEGADAGLRGEAATAPKNTRVILRAPKFEELKLLVKPDTTFERIARAFRDQRQVPANRAVALMFDGERLDPGEAVQDSEIEDLDVVEVHIK